MSAIFLNSKSDGRIYAILAKVAKGLKTKHFCFLDIRLVFKKTLSTLQREPSYTPKRPISKGEKAHFEG